MDRALSPEQQRIQRIRRIIPLMVVLLILAAGVWYLNHSLGNSLEVSRIRTAKVERGPVENTIAASGEVIPAYEQIITSPVRAGIRNVLLTPGSTVQPGDAILELDKSLIMMELEKMKDQLALKHNQIEKLKLKLNKDLFDADINDRIKSLNITRLRADLEDTRRLLKVGGATREDVTRAENVLQIAELEKKQLENDLTYNQESMGAGLAEVKLAADMEEKNVKELEYKLNLADIRADRKGVLTWVNENIGSAIGEGEMLAKVADLGSYRIEGSCSDIYTGQLEQQMPVIVKINEVNLRGTVTQIKPVVKNGVVQFVVQLEDPHHTSLRPNMKVEVFLVTGQRLQTLRVTNGPAFKGKIRQNVYVLKEGIAHLREVETGLSNFDFVEIKTGLQEGDQVILTDLSEYEPARELKIKP